MATVSRSTKVGGGTTLGANTLARATDVETDMLTLFNAHNNHDSGTSKWTVVSVENAVSTALIVNNSSGTNNIAEFRDNGTACVTIADGGAVTLAPGGTTKVVANSSGLTLSNSATIAMGAAKITGLANGTASTDAAAFGQLPPAPVQTTTTSTSSTTSSTYQNSNLSRTFTATTSSKRVKITVHTSWTSNGSSKDIQCSLFRDSTDLDSGSNGFFYERSNFTNVAQGIHITYIDSPATTSQVTYMLKFKSVDNTASVSVIAGEQSSIICEEVS